MYLCIDLKSFYASVECSLRGLDPFKTPLVVCDLERSKNSICLAVTPYLKKLGVKSRTRINDLPKIKNMIYAKPRMRKYMEFSKEIYKIYLSFFSKEDIHVYSIDEVFINLTPYLKYNKKTVLEFAKDVMKKIYENTKITSTSGIGKNMFLAKVALDCLAKKSKDNIGFMTDEIFYNYIHFLDIKDIFGFSDGYAKRLKKFNVKNLHDLSKINVCDLEKEFGIIGREMHEHSFGIDNVDIYEVKNYMIKRKSLTHGQVLMRDYEANEIKTIILEMTDLLVLDLLRNNYKCRCVGLSVVYKDEGGFGRQITLESSTNSQKKILDAMYSLYDKFIDNSKLIRGVRIRASQLEINDYTNFNLFENIELLEKERKFYKVYDDIKEKFGKNSINKAISYTEEGNQIFRNTLIGGHNE